MTVAEFDTKIAIVVRDDLAAVRAVGTEGLDLAGLGVRAGHRDVDAIVRGAARHP